MNTKYDIGDKVWVIASEYYEQRYFLEINSTIENGGTYLYDFSESLEIKKLNWLHNAKIMETKIYKIEIDKDGVHYQSDIKHCFATVSENCIYQSKELAEKALLNYRCGGKCCCCNGKQNININ
jgi:hypothetical protein